MTKRLISLMLAVLMLAVVFVSCADDGDAIDNAVNDASRYTSTINMWVITESALVERASELLLKGNDPDKYPEETYKQNDEQKAFLATLAAENANLEKAWRQLDDVCDRINDLTKKRFKTQVNIKYFTEETYYTKLEGAFLDMAAAKAEADKTGKPIEVRIPLIPGFNSTPEALAGFADILSKLENLTSVKVLPFHHARFKYQALDMTEPLKDLAACSDELAEEVRAFFRKNNINVSDN